MRSQFLEQGQIPDQVFRLFIGSPHQEAGIRFVSQFLQVVHTGDLGGQGMGGRMEARKMQGIRRLEAEEVPLGPGLMEPMVGLPAPLSDGKPQGAVRELLF